MKEKQSVTWRGLAVKLDAFRKRHIECHGLVDEMSLREYSALRRKLSHLLDDLIYPIPDLEYVDTDDEATEWHDVGDTIANVFREIGEDRAGEIIVTRAEFVAFKEKLLRELDAMTERS